MASVPRPHTATVRLTEAQHILARQRFALEHGMTWQKLLTSAVNAYLRGEFRVAPDGTYSWHPGGFEEEPAPPPSSVITAGEEDDAVSLDDLEDYPGRETGPPPEVFGTRKLKALAEQVTGRTVHPHLLRRLIRERFRPEGAQGGHYTWTGPGDPEVQAIIDAIAEGGLDEVRSKGISRASRSRTRP